MSSSRCAQLCVAEHVEKPGNASTPNSESGVAGSCCAGEVRSKSDTGLWEASSQAAVTLIQLFLFQMSRMVLLETRYFSASARVIAVLGGMAPVTGEGRGRAAKISSTEVSLRYPLMRMTMLAKCFWEERVGGCVGVEQSDA
eukprot:1265071-Rhodomonas_salina.1